jgi:UDP-glucose 4-epimerase
MLLSKNFKKIFITGGAGFIGSHLSDILVEEGKEVIVYDNLSTGKKHFLKKSLESKSFTLIEADLLDIRALKKSLPKDTDIVFHLAANADVSKGFSNPELDFNQTIVATFNLLGCMRMKNIKNLVYFSGSGVYGDVGTKFTKENYGPLLPVSMYGATKLSAEGLISAFSNLYGIRSWIFRPANIIGGRATHGVIFDFIKKLRKNPNNLEILGNGQQSKSYVHVNDLLNAVFKGISNGHDKINIFNVSSDSFITVDEIAKIIITALGLTNVRLLHTKGEGGWPGDVPVIRLDNSKLLKLGWKEQFTSRKAVEKTVTEILNEEKNHK